MGSSCAGAAGHDLLEGAGSRIVQRALRLRRAAERDGSRELRRLIDELLELLTDRGASAPAPDAGADGEFTARHYHDLFWSAPVPAVVVDEDGVVTNSNLAAQELLGRYGIAAPFADHLVEEDRPGVRRMLRGGTRLRWSDRTVTVRGARGPRPVSIRCARIDHHSTLLLLLDAAASDGSQPRLKSELQAARAEIARLEERDRVRQALLVTVAHDLRSPLAGVTGLARVLVERTDLPEATRQSVAGHIASATEWVTEQFVAVLDVHRLETGGAPVHRQDVDVAPVVERAVARATAGTHPVSVLVDPFVANADVALFEDVVDNLVRNAHRHTPPGTRIVVRCAPAGDGLRLLVEDEGPGVPAELQRTIFDPGVRSHGSRDDRGFGLGLHIVRTVARLHGGEARHRPRRGGGAVFEVVLPGA